MKPETSAAAVLAAILNFAPVPTRRRCDGWTPERQRRYVAALAGWGSGNVAAAHVGLTPQSAARLRRRPDAADFARACEQAMRIGKIRKRVLVMGPNFFGPGGSHLPYFMNLPARDDAPPRRPGR